MVYFRYSQAHFPRKHSKQRDEARQPLAVASRTQLTKGVLVSVGNGRPSGSVGCGWLRDGASAGWWERAAVTPFQPILTSTACTGKALCHGLSVWGSGGLGVWARVSVCLCLSQSQSQAQAQGQGR
eukprot:114548-Rhodomonas_salina.1